MTVLSEAGRSIPQVWHPWRAIRERPDITVKWERIPGRLGEWCQRTKTMTLHPDQSQRQRRCTVTHELIHAERGHYGVCRSTVERAVSVEAARRLIPLDRLADALVWSQDEWEVSEDLWVDVPTTRLRIETLTQAEKDYIERRIAAREGAT